MYNIIKQKKIWFIFSGILMAASIVFIALGGLRFGIDFTGGSLLEVEFKPVRPEIVQVEEALQSAGLQTVRVQPSQDNNFILRFENVDEVKHQEIIKSLSQIKTDPETTLEELRFESIGPTVGQELKSKAIQAIIIVIIFIVLYIAYAFRHVSKPVASWKYGISAIIALIHDILIVSGIFAALGYFFAVEVDILFVTALLTILGFSIHDTIVTFDRTRENLFKHRDQQFDEIVNLSVNQTIIRSINTSVTTLFVLLAIYIFGGDSIKYFVLALILGVIIGTYSSIFIASPLLSVWNKRR